MSDKLSNYARLVEKEQILYVPTCLIIEIMASAHQFLARVLLNNRLSIDSTGFVIGIIKSVLSDLRCTCEAYQYGKVRMFLGDWYNDRVKAEQVFNHMILNAERLHQEAAAPHKDSLGETIWKMKNEWIRLCRILDSKMAARSGARQSEPRYFHCFDPSHWETTMAMILLQLHETAAYEGPNARLLLLCYSGIKNSLVNRLKEIQSRSYYSLRFDPERIAVISPEQGCGSCPQCLAYNRGMSRQTSVTRLYAGVNGLPVPKYRD